MKKNIFSFIVIFSFLSLLFFPSCENCYDSAYMIYGNIFIRGIDVEQGEVIFVSNMWQDYSYVIRNQNVDKYFVFWEEKDPVGYDIMGVIMNLDGLIEDDPFIVSGETENDHRLPKAAYNPDDNQILVVFFYRSPGNDRDIRGRIVNYDGSIDGEDIIIADGPATQNMPTVAYSTVSREYMVAWDVDLDPNIDERNIYGRRIARDGSPIGDEFLITTTPKDQFYPEIAYNPERDQYMLVWEDFRRSTEMDSWLGKGDIYGSIIDAQGNMVVEDIPICTNDEEQYMPAVEYSTVSHLYFVSFNDQREEPLSWRNANIMGRMVDQDGNLYSDEFTICNAPRNQIYSSVAVDNATGTFCVIWDDGRYKKTPMMQDIMDIFGRFYDAFGNPLGEEFAIARLYGQQHWPIVEARGEDEEFFAVWGDGRKEPDSASPEKYADIYGQVFSRQKRGTGIKCNINLKAGDFEKGLSEVKVTLTHVGLETEAVTCANGSFYVCGFETGQAVTLTPETIEGFSVEPQSRTVTIEGEDLEVEFEYTVSRIKTKTQ